MRNLLTPRWFGWLFLIGLLAVQPVWGQLKSLVPTPDPGGQFVPGEIVVLLKPGVRIEDVQAVKKSVRQDTILRPIRPAAPIEERLATIKDRLRSLQALSRIGQGSDQDIVAAKNKIADLEKMRAKLSLRQKRSRLPPSASDIFDRLWLIRVPEDQVSAQIAALKRQSGVALVERNAIVRDDRVVNDPFMPPFKLPGSVSDFLYGLIKIEAPAAWDLSAGRPDVIVAANESGFDINHPDLAANVWENAGEIPGNGIDDDGNGYIDDRFGVRFDSSLPSQYSIQIQPGTHGTHVAGTIAAVANNNLDVAGVAFNCKLMAATGNNLIERTNAIIYAVDNGADVINNSWSTDYFAPYLLDAIEYAHSRGVVFVASASNDNANTSSKLPAADTKTITVAAHDYLDQRAGFSNFGPKIDVTAPGVSVGSTLPNGGYGALSGTSMSSPHVAGLAALILSRNLDLHEADPVNNPLLTVEQVRQILRKSADDILENPDGETPLAGFDIYSGYGRINARRALELTASASDILEVKIYAPAINYAGNNDEIKFTGGWATVYGPFDLKGVINGSHLDHYVVEEGVGVAPSAWNFVAQGTTQIPGAAGNDLILGNIDSNQLSNGLHTYRIRAFSSSGAVYEDRHLIFVARAMITNYPESWEWQRKTLPLIFSPLNIFGVARSPHFWNYHIEYGVGYAPTQWIPIGPVVTTPVQSPAPLFTGLNQSQLPDGILTLRLVVEDSQVGRSEHDIVVNNDGSQFPFLPGFPNLDASLYTNFNTPVVADLDGDGVKEIIVSATHGIAKLDPNGSIVARALDQSLWEMRSVAAIGNLDSDPELEIAIRGYNYYTNSEAIFVFNHDLSLLGTGPVWTAGFGSVPFSYLDSAYNSVVLHDFDGDGVDELVFTSTGDPLHSVHVMHADGTDLAGWNGGLATDAGSPHTPAIGDINGDGLAEILVSDINGQLSAFASNGNRLWQVPGVSNLEMQITLADIDQDGAYEILYNQGPSIKIFNGSGVLVRSIDNLGLQVSHYALGDLNNDGKVDVVSASYGFTTSGPIGFFLNANSLTDGVGLAGLPNVQVENNLPGYPVIADIDGNGSKEMIVGTGSSSIQAVYAYRSDGSRIESLEDPRFPFRKSGALVTSPVLADVNGDGTMELLYDPVNSAPIAYQLPGSLAADGSDWTSPYFDQKNTGRYQTVSTANPKPDLLVERIELGPDKMPTVFFANHGSASVLSNAILRIRMLVGATVVFAQDIALNELPSQSYRSPGGVGSANLNIIMSYAIRDIEATIDVTNLVAESDETNNQITTNLKSLPDLMISNLDVLPNGLVAVTVTNQGNDIVPWYIPTLNLNVQLVGTSQSSTINLRSLSDQGYTLIGGTSQVIVTDWAVPSGVSTIRATVDSGQQLVELSEGNNQLTATRTRSD